jgi:hypothetical protein
MSAPSTAQVLENASRTASERQHLANLARLDAEWRRIAHVGDGNTHPPITTKAVARRGPRPPSASGSAQSRTTGRTPRGPSSSATPLPQSVSAASSASSKPTARPLPRLEVPR